MTWTFFSCYRPDKLPDEKCPYPGINIQVLLRNVWYQKWREWQRNHEKSLYSFSKNELIRNSYSLIRVFHSQGAVRYGIIYRMGVSRRTTPNQRQK